MNPVSLIAGVNRVTLNTAAPAAPTDGVADDANIAGMFIYSRVPIRIWQMNNSNTWSELDLLTGSGGSRIATVYFDATDVTRIFLQSTGDDNVTVRVVRREQEGSNVQQEGANQRVHVAATFRSLSDTPNAYTGQAGKYPRVNDGETGIEFVESSGEGAQGPTGPQGPAGADGADGGIGTAVLGNPHVTTGSFKLHVPNDGTATLSPEGGFHGWDSNPTLPGAGQDAGQDVGVTIDNVSSDIPTLNVGGLKGEWGTSVHHVDNYGFEAINRNVNRPDYRHSFTDYVPHYHAHWLSGIQGGGRRKNPHLTSAGNHTHGIYRTNNGLSTWESDWTTMPRYYTFGPEGGGPTGARLQVTGTVAMTPQSALFIGDSNEDSIHTYPELWNAASSDALYVSRNNFVNNAKNTFWRFGKSNSVVHFAHSSSITIPESTIYMDNTRLQFQQKEDTVINGHDYRLAPPNSGSWILVDEHGVFTPPRNWRHWDQRVLSTHVRSPTSYYTTGQYSAGSPGTVDPARVSYAGNHIAMDRVIIDPKDSTQRPSGIFKSHVINLFYNAADFYHSKSIDGGPAARWWADFNVHGNAKFQNDVTVTNSINITPIANTYNAIQPTGCDSPLWVRQRGTSFGHSILLDKPEGDHYYGWGVRTNADRHLEFKAYITDDDQSTPELLDSTWNLASHGRAYIARYSNAANLTFTGQHRSRPEAGTAEEFKNKVGLIVVAAGKYMAMSGSNISINDSMPTVELASKSNDKRVFGVISDSEDSDSEEREFSVGAFVTAYDKVDGDDRVIINSVGEGAMWVTDINGNIENGDYITSSDIPGYGMKQDDDLLHNYTVAKITMDCDFDLSSTEYRCEQIGSYKRAFVGVTYHCG